MDEELLIFALACLALLLIVGGPLAALIALVQVRRLRRELRELRGTLLAPERERPRERAVPGETLPEPPAAAIEQPAAPRAPAEEERALPGPLEATPETPGPLEEPAPWSLVRPPWKRRAAPGELQRAIDPERKRAIDPERKRAVEWERWIGVRGAAVVGGVLLALAAVLFFRHAFIAGWISPPLRVACGVAAGLACVGGGLRLRGRGYGWAPDALIGAGIVALYASVWAADKRYHLLSTVASFPLMALITALACVLALRLSSLLVAVLGLVGGFATPLLLSSGQDRPISLFGYVLVLDMALVFLGRARRWPAIGVLALLGTFGLESLWVFTRMGERAWLGLAIVAVFAALFPLAGAALQREERKRWLPAQLGAVLFPFVFAFQFAGELQFRGHVWPVALLLGLLFVAAVVIQRQGRTSDRPGLAGAHWLPNGAATASVAVVGVWLFSLEHRATQVFWELAGVSAGLAALAHVFAEWERRSATRERPLALAAGVSGAAWLVLDVAGSSLSRSAMLWPILLGLAALAALVCRQAVLLGRGFLIVAAGTGLGLGLGLFHAVHAASSAEPVPDARLFLTLPVVLAAGFLGALPRLAPAFARASAHGAVALFLMFAALLPLHASYAEHDPWLLPLAALVFGVLMMSAAVRFENSVWAASALFVTLVLDWIWTDQVLFGPESRPRSEEFLLTALGLVSLAPLVLLLVATAVPGAFREARLAWPFLALAAPLLSDPVGWFYSARFGPTLEGLPYLVLALGPALGALRLRAVQAAGGPRAWLAASASFLLSAGIADQLDHEEFAVGCALWALSLALLARALALPLAGWTASLVSALATVALLASALDTGPTTSARSACS